MYLISSVDEETCKQITEIRYFTFNIFIYMNPVFKSLKRITVSYEKLSVFGSLPATN